MDQKLLLSQMEVINVHFQLVLDGFFYSVVIFLVQILVPVKSSEEAICH